MSGTLELRAATVLLNVREDVDVADDMGSSLGFPLGEDGKGQDSLAEGSGEPVDDLAGAEELVNCCLSL